MLIPKQTRKEAVLNPFRPKIGVPRTHTVCKVSWGDFHLEEEEVVQRLRVDADHDDEFVSVMEATVPREDRHRCNDHELWLIDKKWKKFIVDTAKQFFDDVKIELRSW